MVATKVMSFDLWPLPYIYHTLDLSYSGTEEHSRWRPEKDLTSLSVEKVILLQNCLETVIF